MAFHTRSQSPGAGYLWSNVVKLTLYPAEIPLITNTADAPEDPGAFKLMPAQLNGFQYSRNSRQAPPLRERPSQ